MLQAPGSFLWPNLLSCSVALALAFAGTAYGLDAGDIVALHDAQVWHLGKGIVPGDYFVYAVCDISVHPSTDECYTVRLDFVAELMSATGQTWVVQAEITDSAHALHNHIFLVDSETFRIDTGHRGTGYADSVEDTVFYLARFASAHDPKQFEIGTVWGDVPTTLNGAELVVASEDEVYITGAGAVRVAVLEYWAFGTSTFAVSESMGLPVSATVYGPYVASGVPRLDFTFELTDFSVGSGARMPAGPGPTNYSSSSAAAATAAKTGAVAINPEIYICQLPG